MDFIEIPQHTYVCDFFFWIEIGYSRNEPNGFGPLSAAGRKLFDPFSAGVRKIRCFSWSSRGFPVQANIETIRLTECFRLAEMFSVDQYSFNLVHDDSSILYMTILIEGSMTPTWIVWIVPYQFGAVELLFERI